jgi:hypothetical protein
MNSRKILVKFLRNFKKRIQLHDKKYISEDSKRYDFFAACLLLGVDTHLMKLEYPHNHKLLSALEIDLVIDDIIAIEFKLFKRIPSRHDDSTKNMAIFIIDLLKLHYLSGFEEKYFLFITDDLMRNYISNPSNGFSIFHTSLINTTFTIIPNIKSGKHYQEIISGKFNNNLSPLCQNITVEKIAYKEINGDYLVGCFKVISTSQTNNNTAQIT